MPTHVALLRGINLGSHHRVAMPALRELVAGLGHTEVATYIASGNVVFTATGSSTDALATELETAIAAQLDVSPRVVVLTCADLARVVADNPYPDQTDHKRLHAFFLIGDPAAARAHLATVLERIAAKLGRDAATVVRRTLYLHTPDGFGTSELATQLSKPRGPAEGTARNWATVLRLHAMCAA